MRWITRSMVLTMVMTTALALAALPAAARPGGPFGERGHGPGDPLMRAVERLGLDDGQRESIRAVLDAQRDDADRRRETVRTAHDALHAAVHAESVDEDAIRAASAELAALHEARALARARTFVAVRELLTPAQQDELTAMIAERAERRETRREARGERGSDERRGEPGRWNRGAF